MTHERIPLAAVLGHPVGHSRSPRLHGHWLQTHGLAGYYVPIDVSAGNLQRVVEMLPELGFVGFNVTVPHKEAMISLCGKVSDRAARIGAANTITFLEDGTVAADNTDGEGFIENLRQNAAEWDARSGPAAIFGAGGAARAVIVSLLDAGAPEIRLTNRSRDRADKLRREFGNRITVHDWIPCNGFLDGATTVVNTTSLGMTGNPDVPLHLGELSPAAVVTDLVYTPLETALLRVARQKGCRTVDGLGMLLHQGVPGFERWFGHRPVVDDALRRTVLAG